MRQGRGDAPHANLFVVPHHFLTTFGQLQTPHAAVASLGDAVDQLGPLQPVGKLRHRVSETPNSRLSADIGRGPWERTPQTLN